MARWVDTMTLRWIAYVVMFFAFVLGAIVYRHAKIARYPMGGGCYESSPNDQFIASAQNMYDEDAWGNARVYYEFEVSDKHGKVLRTIQLPQPSNAIDFRNGPGSIMWASDSKSVDFGMPGTVVWSTPVP